MNNKVTVIMSVYNETLNEVKESFESIKNQTYKNLEIIIIIDNPNINKKILEILEEKNNENIIILKNKKNIGLARSLNKGIEISSGKYIARIDADDIMLKDRIRKQVEYLDKNPEIELLGSQAIIIDENGYEKSKTNLPIKFEKIKVKMKYESCFIHPSIIIKKEVFDKVGLYRELPCAQDYDLFYRIIDLNLRSENLEEALIKYRVRSEGLSVKKGLIQFLLSEYIKKLALERKKNGKDSFDIKDINKIINVDEKMLKKYSKAKEYLISSQGRKKIFRIFDYLIASLYCKYYFKIAIRGILFKIL